MDGKASRNLSVQPNISEGVFVVVVAHVHSAENLHICLKNTFVFIMKSFNFRNKTFIYLFFARGSYYAVLAILELSMFWNS